MFSHGQNYPNLCQNPAINLNVKVAPKLKFENLPRGCAAIACRKPTDKISTDVDIANQMIPLK